MEVGGTIEEDASQCIFPQELEAAETFLNAKVYGLLEHQKQQNEECRMNSNFHETFQLHSFFQPFQKQRDHCQ